MNKKICGMIAMLALVSMCYCYGMQEEAVHAVKVYVIPGLGGYKPEEKEKNEAYAAMLFPADDKTQIDITHVVIPAEYGLGQEKCADYIEDAIREEEAEDTAAGKQYAGKVLLACSQGGATVVNLIKDNRLLISNLNMMVLEGLFLDANEAICHSVRGARAGSYGVLADLPLLRYWLPYCAKLIKFPHYNPSGPHPIHGVPHIPKELPLIIIHGQADQRVPHDNALVLYSYLKNQGKNNVYLMSKKCGLDTIAQSKDHVTVLDHSDVSVVQAILRKYGILRRTEGASEIDLTTYQPQLEPTTMEHYINLYHAQRAQLETHQRIQQGINTATIVVSTAVAYWAIKKMLKKDSDLINEVTSLPDSGFYLSNVLALANEYLVGR